MPLTPARISGLFMATAMLCLACSGSTEPDLTPRARIVVIPDTVVATVQAYLDTFGAPAGQRVIVTASFVVFNEGSTTLSYDADECDLRFGQNLSPEWDRPFAWFCSERVGFRYELPPGQSRAHVLAAGGTMQEAWSSVGVSADEGDYQLQMLVSPTGSVGRDVPVLSNPVYLKVVRLAPLDGSKGWRVP